MNCAGLNSPGKTQVIKIFLPSRFYDTECSHMNGTGLNLPGKTQVIKNFLPLRCYGTVSSHEWYRS